MLHALFLLHLLLSDLDALAAIARGVSKLSLASLVVFWGVALHWLAFGWPASRRRD